MNFDVALSNYLPTETDVRVKEYNYSYPIPKNYNKKIIIRKKKTRGELRHEEYLHKQKRLKHDRYLWHKPWIYRNSNINKIYKRNRQKKVRQCKFVGNYSYFKKVCNDD